MTRISDEERVEAIIAAIRRKGKFVLVERHFGVSDDDPSEERIREVHVKNGIMFQPVIERYPSNDQFRALDAAHLINLKWGGLA